MQAAQDTVRCHLIVLLILWLALFAPIVCQYHGVMLHFGGDNAHTHLDHADQPPPDSRFHEMASSVTMLMGLFVAAMPDGVMLPVSVPSSSVHIRDILLPAQPELPVPHQPPRFF